MRQIFVILLFLPFIAHADVTSENIINVYTSNPHFSIQVKTYPVKGFFWSIKSMDEKLFKRINKTVRYTLSNLLSTRGGKTFSFELKPRKHYPANSEITFFYSHFKHSQKGSIKKYKIKIIDDKN